MTNIAILLTCFNRKDKTLSSLHSLYSALEYYNHKIEDSTKRIASVVYLTDDGCTDGTGEGIQKEFADKDIHILKGNGSLFWAGGMRFAWNEALKRKEEWDYYLLLNDDTTLFETAFEELMATNDYCQKTYSKSGIYSGITCSPTDHSKITYGGDIFLNKFTGKRRRLGVSDHPQMCDLTNANILLVSKEVVDKIGVLYDGYIHGAADYDYTYMARKSGFPVLITAKQCGECDFDHKTDDDKRELFLSMTLAERKKYISNPLRSGEDYVTLIKRTMPMKYPMTWIFRQLNLYMPRLYYWLNGRR